MISSNNNTTALNEQEYRSHIFEEIILVTRLVSGLGIAMFLSFYVVDFWAIYSIYFNKLFFLTFKYMIGSN